MTDESDAVTVIDQRFELGDMKYRYVTRYVTAANGKVRETAQFSAIGEDERWVDFPLRLDWKSLIAGRLFAHWPPYFIDDLRKIGKRLVMVFHDPEYDERPLLPFGLDEESEWEASYSDANQTWRLRRIRRLDYEGADRHLRYDRPPHRHGQ